MIIGTGMEEHMNYAVDFINAVSWIKKNLKHAKTSGGVSNVSFSFRGNDQVREAIHSVFLYHAIKAGLDMGIVNPGMLQIYDEIPKDFLEKVENLVLNKKPEATEELLEFAQTLKAQDAKEERKDEWRDLPVEKRLEHALVKGLPDYIDIDLAEALPLYTPVLNIIEVSADGRDECGWRLVWRRQNVSSAGDQIGARDEKSGGLFAALH